MKPWPWPWPRPARRQCAALPWRPAPGGGVEVLLVTSRGTGRWILPKGGVNPGQSAAQSAAQEAWEEGGVRGALDPRPLGAYRYARGLPRGRVQPCRVEVFPLRVETELDRWPEQGQRRRVWLDLAAAVDRVDEPGLRALLASLSPGPPPRRA